MSHQDSPAVDHCEQRGSCDGCPYAQAYALFHRGAMLPNHVYRTRQEADAARVAGATDSVRSSTILEGC